MILSPTLLAFLVGLAAGFIIGLVIALLWRRSRERTAKELADEILRESEAQRQASLTGVIEHVKASFGSLSLEALKKSTDQLLELAQARMETEREVGARELESKKGLIDQQLRQMTSALEGISTLMKELERDRVEKFGELASQLRTTREQTAALTQSTALLNEALASTKARGQWGERMAEDVLRLAGFIEGVNYEKQKSIEGIGSRPDFTFLLPKDLKLNMDVKFPLDNYLAFLKAGSDPERARFRSEFLKNVRARFKEVTTREYIDPGQGTLDCVLLFIPNEQIYGFIHEQDPGLLDDGVRNRVILCSPITLFAVLAVIREAIDHFVLQQTSNEILSLMGSFRKQWEAFVGVFDKLGRSIEGVQKDYQALTNTRRQKLQKPLDQIEALRRQRHLEIATDEEEAPPANDAFHPGDPC